VALLFTAVIAERLIVFTIHSSVTSNAAPTITQVVPPSTE
jgi:hypothetical protein